MPGKRYIGKSKGPVAKAVVTAPLESSFAEVVQLIQQSHQRAYQAVNSELIDLYWRVGEYISRKLQSAEWGDGVVAELALFERAVLNPPKTSSALIQEAMLPDKVLLRTKLHEFYQRLALPKPDTQEGRSARKKTAARGTRKAGRK